MYNLFVYGTLKKDFYNHHVIEQANGKFIGEGITDPNFTMFSLGSYPGIYNHGDTRIKGEVYEVSSLQHTDWLEGYPDFYSRTVVPINVEGKNIMATMYYIDGPINHQGLIEEGEWV